MPAAVVGRGTTFAVLLHQSDGDGLCGFWPFADWLAREHGVHVVLFDLCGYGKADCPDKTYENDQGAQVATAVRWARDHGAKRVVLVGASMGGALALADAPQTKADAVVDLSGPDWWPNADAQVAARTLTVPTLLAVSPTDTNTSYSVLRTASTRIRARKKLFVTGEGPHGWDLLADRRAAAIRWLPLATSVARWITSP